MSATALYSVGHVCVRYTVVDMYERGPMSEEFALLISRTLAACASLADSFQLPEEGYLPAGRFGADREAIQCLDGQQKQV